MIDHGSRSTWGPGPYTFESRASRERILNTQGETERLKGPKSIVGPFDEIRRVSKASRVKS